MSSIYQFSDQREEDRWVNRPERWRARRVPLENVVDPRTEILPHQIVPQDARSSSFPTNAHRKMPRF